MVPPSPLVEGPSLEHDGKMTKKAPAPEGVIFGPAQVGKETFAVKTLSCLFAAWPITFVMASAASFTARFAFKRLRYMRVP